MNVMHLGTYGILTKDGQILLIKKSRGPYTGKLDLPGGRLEHGEGVLTALAREITEETGVIMKKTSFLTNATAIVNFTDERGDVSMYHVGLLYLVDEFSDDKLITVMSVEDSFGANWYDLTKLNEKELSPFAMMAVGHLRGA